MKKVNQTTELLKSNKKQKRLSPNYRIGFMEAWKRFVLRSFNFSGRATRAEFWKAIIVFYPLTTALSLILVLGLTFVYFGAFPEDFFDGELAVNICYIGWLFLVLVVVILAAIPIVALSSRRAHDCGQSALAVVSLFEFQIVYGIYKVCVELADCSALLSLWTKLQLLILPAKLSTKEWNATNIEWFSAESGGFGVDCNIKRIGTEDAVNDLTEDISFRIISIGYRHLF